MRIAKLTVGIDNPGIVYNKARDIGLEVIPQVTPDGGPVRGGGTHYESPAAKERFDRLTSKGNKIRRKFEMRFLKAPEIDGVFMIPTPGQGKEFIAGLDIDVGLRVKVTEFEFESTNSGLDGSEMAAWAEKAKNQLVRIPLGREKDQIDGEGLKALEYLSDCPALSETTRNAIKVLVSGVKVGTINKVDFKRSISLLDVEMDQTPLQPRRVGPTE